LIEYDPPANGTAQYNRMADCLSFQPTATCSSPPPQGPEFSLKVQETMQNTIASAPSIHPFVSPIISGTRCDGLHSSPSSVPTACCMVYPSQGPIINTAGYPVAQSAIAYSPTSSSTVQQATYPMLQGVSTGFQGIGDNSDSYSLHTGQSPNLLLGGSCGHQTLPSSSIAQLSSSSFLDHAL
jgi:hypothetical protein